ncbi:bifunctional enoyl-CoA hydratase/phosphate acetyltransferase [Salipaludibacillus sp. LMS25]|jgi:phosphate butyryltransferase|uniref:bifunctional enoyl-CoA hydratase/phosphate acetyltransferase n=1 Tax=Salipaludibacillus sp. LMS25 TaxID=2924031 RepID=UPI0020D1DE52|nr:bifunctional enoyl-CoA hydratase/phosphate acetyltransferase [Salipaludibacillus sp. LMS25]UTR14505.1 bifunctional enoyl-CoA hydratase/phosphate acetyltransferase [Salipaludibacillus sp. LMS25]
MNLETLFQKVKKQPTETVAVAHAVDPSVFLTAERAIEEDIASFIFTGPREEMEKAAKKAGFSFRHDPRVQWINTPDENSSANKAIELIKEHHASVLMKGMLPTAVLLKAVLKKEGGLRTGNILSHVAGFSLPHRNKLLFITDSAMNISPDLTDKTAIVQNAVTAVKRMGVSKPKVAILAAVETVNTNMPATLDAASLVQMSKRGQINDCVIDGPLGFDSAVSTEAAEQKNIQSSVAGQADILLVPSIEAGNILYKSLTYFAGATVGGLLVGARAAVVVSSRSDSVDSKLFSLAMAISTKISKKSITQGE